jgi:hypothetical protein
MSTLTLNDKYNFAFLDSVHISSQFVDGITTLLYKLKANKIFGQQPGNKSTSPPKKIPVPIGNRPEREKKTALQKPTSYDATTEKDGVFINAAPEDLKLANEITQSLQERNIHYCPPLDIYAKPTDMRKNLEQNLLSCRAVLILYDKAHLVWVLQQLRYCQRMQTLHDQPIKIWVYTPSKKPSLDEKKFNIEFHLVSKLEDFLSSYEVL